MSITLQVNYSRPFTLKLPRELLAARHFCFCLILQKFNDRLLQYTHLAPQSVSLTFNYWYLKIVGVDCNFNEYFCDVH